MGTETAKLKATGTHKKGLSGAALGPILKKFSTSTKRAVSDSKEGGEGLPKKKMRRSSDRDLASLYLFSTAQASSRSLRSCSSRSSLALSTMSAMDRSPSPVPSSPTPSSPGPSSDRF